jgi:hypothetical protein
MGISHPLVFPRMNLLPIDGCRITLPDAHITAADVRCINDVE